MQQQGDIKVGGYGGTGLERTVRESFRGKQRSVHRGGFKSEEEISWASLTSDNPILTSWGKKGL